MNRTKAYEAKPLCFFFFFVSTTVIFFIVSRSFYICIVGNEIAEPQHNRSTTRVAQYRALLETHLYYVQVDAAQKFMWVILTFPFRPMRFSFSQSIYVCVFFISPFFARGVILLFCVSPGPKNDDRRRALLIYSFLAQRRSWRIRLGKFREPKKIPLYKSFQFSVAGCINVLFCSVAERCEYFITVTYGCRRYCGIVGAYNSGNYEFSSMFYTFSKCT